MRINEVVAHIKFRINDYKMYIENEKQKKIVNCNEIDKMNIKRHVHKTLKHINEIEQSVMSQSVKVRYKI